MKYIQNLNLNSNIFKIKIIFNSSYLQSSSAGNIFCLNKTAARLISNSNIQLSNSRSSQIISILSNAGYSKYVQ